MSAKAILFSVLFILITFQGYRITRDSGYLIEIQPKSFGSCEKLVGPPGSEDINIDANNHVAFISSGNGREVFDSYRTGSRARVENGDIWVLDLAKQGSVPRRLNVDIGGSFHPHGIDLLELDTGERELYVVNHPSRDQHEILIFSVKQDHGLTLKKRIHYPELISPNDIKAIAGNRFFVTNDHGSPQSSVMARIEEYLGLARSSVTYFDGEKGFFVLKGINSANGITLSEKQDTLYVAEAIGRSVKRFKRGDSVHDWEYLDKVSVNTAVDNLEWSEDGKLLAGAHPKLFDLLSHVKDADNRSPSQVISINVETSPMSYETLYMNDGSEMSGSSVATMLNGDLLIGGILDTHFLRCSKN